MKPAPDGFCFDPEIFERLLQVKRRLYDHKTLTADERRDLANRLDALLSQSSPIYLER
jgi:hypothetical protein